MSFARQGKSTGNWLYSPAPIYRKWALLASANLLEIGFAHQTKPTGSRTAFFRASSATTLVGLVLEVANTL